MGVAKIKHFARGRASSSWTENGSNGTHAMTGKSLDYINGKLHLILQNSYGTNSQAAIAYEDLCAIENAFLLLDTTKKEEQESELVQWETMNNSDSRLELATSKEAETSPLKLIPHLRK